MILELFLQGYFENTALKISGVEKSALNRSCECFKGTMQNVPATFFRSIGAMLGYLPPKGSLAGKTTPNYRFSPKDSEQIREWMRQSLLVNCLPVKKSAIEEEEKRLIVKYMPLVNIKDNPMASDEINKARKRCVSFARGEDI